MNNCSAVLIDPAALRTSIKAMTSACDRVIEPRRTELTPIVLSRSSKIRSRLSFSTLCFLRRQARVTRSDCSTVLDIAPRLNTRNQTRRLALQTQRLPRRRRRLSTVSGSAEVLLRSPERCRWIIVHLIYYHSMKKPTPDRYISLFDFEVPALIRYSAFRLTKST